MKTERDKMRGKIVLMSIVAGTWLAGCVNNPWDASSDNAIQYRSPEICPTEPSLKYSFQREEYVNPLIVQELCGCLADKHESVISIDLSAGNTSNRFSGDFKIRLIKGRQWIWHDETDGGFFAYHFVGESPSGVNIVRCMESGGGSGVFERLIFLVFSSDLAVGETLKNSPSLEHRRRLLLTTLGQINLGDRYDGKITYDGEKLTIGHDTSPMKHGGSTKPQEITVR